MDIVEKIRELKKKESKSIIFIKIGSFYNVYEEDSFILSYLFGYKIKIENNFRTCGFQITSSLKVFSKLKEKQINYLIIDKRLNYEETSKIDFKRKNQYKNILKIALPYVKLKERLDILCQNILENVNQNISENIDNQKLKIEFENLENIEKILYQFNTSILTSGSK